MNETTYFFIALCAAALLWNLASGIRIVRELEKTSAAKSMFVMRYMPWRYLHEYRNVTTSKSGSTGALYYHYTFSIVALLLAALVLVVLLAL